MDLPARGYSLTSSPHLVLYTRPHSAGRHPFFWTLPINLSSEALSSHCRLPSQIDCVSIQSAPGQPATRLGQTGPTTRNVELSASLPICA